ncbi:hypothetical protein NDU88_000734 [Pleurodeles waltl]|uniref:Uncharacterized protein n=1 Tax=Pleurodeles waltl TaxID=8319 RepID=A0AAV7UQV0_PLEWA|nr:hypothetical protein NDU88_000734 [Pleurodeles waltl]
MPSLATGAEKNHPLRRAPGVRKPVRVVRGTPARSLAAPPSVTPHCTEPRRRGYNAASNHPLNVRKQRVPAAVVAFYYQAASQVQTPVQISRSARRHLGSRFPDFLDLHEL